MRPSFSRDDPLQPTHHHQQKQQQQTLSAPSFPTKLPFPAPFFTSLFLPLASLPLLSPHQPDSFPSLSTVCILGFLHLFSSLYHSPFVQGFTLFPLSTLLFFSLNQRKGEGTAEEEGRKEEVRNGRGDEEGRRGEKGGGETGLREGRPVREAGCLCNVESESQGPVPTYMLNCIHNPNLPSKFTQD